MLLFAQSGEINTEETLKIALDELKRNGGNTLLISSTRGNSAMKALELIPKDVRLIVVTHSQGFKEPNTNEFSSELRQKLVSEGHVVLTATHALSGLERSFRREFGGVYPSEIVANALRLFSQGVKVCVEIAVMAADAGLVRCDEWIVSCGGTGEGLDTAMVIKPANSSNFFELQVGTILCMPSAYSS